MKGGLIVDAQTETMLGELTYYNVTQFTFKRQEFKPIWDPVESYIVKEGKTRSTPAVPMAGKRRISETNIGYQASMILLKSGESKDRLLMYDFEMPYLTKT